ncbi:MAG: CBS domain-containing protein [Armatimonas sp.]
MTKDPEVIRPDANLQEAAETMHQLDIGPLPVCDGGKLVGMLTDRDITVRSTALGRDPFTTLVRDIMTEDKVQFVYEDQDVNEAAHIMEEHQIRRLVVLDRNQSLVGIVSLGDLAVSGTADKVTAQALETISQPEDTHP